MTEISEEDAMIRDMFRKLVRSRLVPIENALLSGARSDAEAAAEIRSSIEEMGVRGMNVPEALGGGGISVLGGVLAALELGWTFIDASVGDVPPPLLECDGGQRKLFLDPVVEGSLSLGVAFRDLPGGLETRAAADNGCFVLEGDKILGREPGRPDLFLVFARTAEGAPRESQTCFIARRDAPGIDSDGRALRLRSARIPAAQVLGKPGGACMLGRKWFPAARLRKAARQIGTAGRLIDVCAAYARDWTKFGRPLSVLPSVLRDLADSASETAAARSLAIDAAANADAGRDIGRESMMTRLLAHDLLGRVAARAVEIHGGPLPHFRVWAGKEDGGSALDLLRLGISRGLMKAS